MNILTVIRLVVISSLLKCVNILVHLPSDDIDTFIRITALKSMFKIGLKRTVWLFINPISSLRYLEFDFAKRHLSVSQKAKILDISSPRVLGFYLCRKHPTITYVMINPDKEDRLETKKQLLAFTPHKFILTNTDARKLPYPNGSFDAIISISVIEHIAGNGDRRAVKEMWRVLKHGGKLLITTHVTNTYEEEYRYIDQYNIYNKNKKKYFFQRMYDKKTIDKRIYKSIGDNPKIVEIFGEKEKGWFDEYVKRWREKGLKETVWDPWYIMSKFQKYDAIEQLPGVGIIGLVFEKK